MLKRRAEAKAAIRRFADDVSFQVGKESKDRLRLVQRLLRDHFTDIAEQGAALDQRIPPRHSGSRAVGIE